MAVKEPKAPLKREPEYVDKPSPFSIEGIRSGAVQSRVVKTMIVLSGLIMAGTFAISSFSPSGIPQNGSGGAQQSPTQLVATVGDQTITAGQLYNAFQRSIDTKVQYGFGSKPTVASFLDDKQGVLRQLTDQASLVVDAKKEGFTVSDDEIDKEIDKEIRQNLKPQQGQSQAAFLRLLQTQYKANSVEEAVNQIKSKVTPDGRDLTRNQLLVQKLEKATRDKVKTTEADYKKSVTKLDLYQIVVRPDLPKGNVKDFVAEQKRLQGLAKDKADKLYAQLKANPTLANFKTVAAKESADTLTKAKGGSLGLKLPTEAQPADAADTLKATTQGLAGPFANPGDGSQTIFFVAGQKLDLPKDYDKNKKTVLATYQKSEEDSAWQKKQEEVQKAVTPDVSDPDMAAYQLQTTIYSKPQAEQEKARQDILTRYDDALGVVGKTGMEAAAINYQKSTIYRDMGQKQPQMDALKAAVDAYKNDAGLLIAYGQSLQDAGQPKVALEQFKAASAAMDANPSTPSPFGGNPDDGMRQQLATQFDILKEPKLAAEERAKIKPSAPAMSGAGGLNLGGLPPGIKISPAKPK